MKQEEDDDDADDDGLFEQVPLQGFDGCMNQTGAVVTGDNSTPGGSEGLISVSFFLTPSMTVRAFIPSRMTTMPATVSPSPCHSATPSRMSGPKLTVPRSRTRMGVPFFVATGTVSKSFKERKYPRPRIMYCAPPISSRRPPTSLVLARTFSITVERGML